MVEKGGNKASQPGASAIGTENSVDEAFHSSSVSVESRFRGLGGRLKSVTGWDSSTECNRCKESSLVGDCRNPSSLCLDGYLWVVCRAT